jgi:uncharacterized delta-60 repeat protein
MRKHYLVLLLSIAFAMVQIKAQTGNLDQSFGQGGIVKTDFIPDIPVLNSTVRRVLPASDGSYYFVLDVAGQAVIAHRLEDGSGDLVFGNNGYSAPVQLNIQDAFLQDDGKIIAVGTGYLPNVGSAFTLVRFNSDGSQDLSFGANGRVQSAYPVDNASQPVHIQSVAKQSDGKFILGGNTYNGNGYEFYVTRFHSNGTVDYTFGNNGKVQTAVSTTPSGYYAVVQAIAVQADGKVIAAGRAQSSIGNFFALVRYNSDGSIDNSFDTDGKVLTPFLSTSGSTSAYLNSLAIQEDGKIIAAGESYLGNSGYSFALARYNSDGTLDNLFDEDGKVQTSFFYNGSNSSAVGRSLAVQGDGKIIVSGNAFDGTHNTTAVARYNTDGALDVSFDADGKMQVSLGDNINSVPYTLLLQSDNKLLVAGYSYNNTINSQDLAAVRFNSNGSVDATFDADGIVMDNIESGSTSFAATAIQSDGKIIAGGQTRINNASYSFALARYTPDGSLDVAFGNEGTVQTSFGSTDSYNQSYIYSLLIQDDGKIIAAGGKYSNGSVLAVARYNSNGSLDATFDGDGKVETPYLYDGINSEASALAIAVQNDGKVVIAGRARIGSISYGGLIVRYNVNGSLDATFGTGGKVIVNLSNDGSNQFEINSLTVLTDGKIVAGGYSSFSSGGTFTLVRLNSNGSLDASFDGDGKVYTSFANTQESSSGYLYALAVQIDGKIIGAGESNITGLSTSYTLVRYNTDGSLDNTFDGDGKVVTQVADPAGGYSWISSLSIQSNGKILAAGFNYSANQLTFLRYNVDGTLDNTYSQDGIAQGPSNLPNYYWGMSITPTRIYVPGYEPYYSSVGSVAAFISECENQTYYADNDKDGFGNSSVSVQACTAPEGYVDEGTDCDDNDALVHSTPPPPNITAVELCPGSTVASLPQKEGAYKWYNFINGAPLPLSYQFTSSGTLWVTNSVGGCESAKQPVILTVVYVATPTLAAPAAVCPGINSGSIVVTNAQAGVTYQLLSNGSPMQNIAPQVGVSGTSIISFSDVPLGTYTVRATYAACPPANSSPVTLTTRNVPVPVLGPVNPLCPGGAANLTAAFPSGTTVTGVIWSGAGVSGSVFTAPSTAGAYAINYSAIVNGCPVSSSFIISVLPSPAPPNISALEICAGSMVASLPQGDGAYKWYNFINGAPLPLSYQFVDPGTLWVTNTINGCESAKQAVTLTLSSVPTFTLLGNSFCQGGTGVVTLSGSQSGISYQLMNNGVNVGPPLLGTGSVLSFVGLEAGTYSVVATNSLGCTYTGPAAVVTMIAAPPPPAAQSVVRCGPGMVNLVAFGCSGGLISWYANPEDVLPIATGSNFSPHVTQSTKYFVSCRLNGCESSKAPVLVTINPVLLPTIIGPTHINLSSGTSYPYTANVSGATGPVTFQWSTVPTDPYTKLTGTNTPTALFTVTDLMNFQASYILQVTATSDQNCPTSSSLVVSLSRDPVLTWANPEGIAAGTPLTATQLNATADVPGTFTYTPVAGTMLSAGNNQPLKVDFVPTDEVRFTNISKTVFINVNGAPVLTVSGIGTVPEGTPVNITAFASDVNNDNITYGLTGPAGATINPLTGKVSWTPSEEQGPGIYPLMITATDNGSPVQSSSTVFVVSVTEVNVAPVLTPIGNKDVVAQNILSFEVLGTDADHPLQTLTYTTSQLPQGATFDAATRKFSWTPASNQTGSYQVTFIVTDGSLSHQETITINVSAPIVTPPTTSAPPVITSFSPGSGPCGSEVAISGLNFSGVTKVQFGTVNAVFRIASPSKIYAIVPPGAVTNKITVASSAGSVTSGARFRVTTSCPVTITTMEKNSLSEKSIPEKLEVVAFPNPSSGYFILKVSSQSADAISLKVTDLLGRIVERRFEIGVGVKLQLGGSYRSGVYIVEVVQGEKRRMLKLVKQ